MSTANGPHAFGRDSPLSHKRKRGLSIGRRALDLPETRRMASTFNPQGITNMSDETTWFHFSRARAQARLGLGQGGIPIGAVLVEGGVIVAEGYNRRVQEGDPIAHGEMDCLRKAGRRSGYRNTILMTTLSPCMMCAGTIIQFGIPKVIIGENRTFGGNEELLRQRGVEVVVLDDPECLRMMKEFIEAHPEIWREDIAA
jgi:creatinine deaminase